MKQYNKGDKNRLWDLSAISAGLTFDGFTSSNEKKKIKEAAKKYVKHCLEAGIPIICRQPIIKECLKELEETQKEIKDLLKF